MRPEDAAEEAARLATEEQALRDQAHFNDNKPKPPPAAKEQPQQAPKAAKAKPSEADLQKKAAIKEGGKKAQDIAGYMVKFAFGLIFCSLSDLGGVKFFHLAMNDSNGDLDLLQVGL